jgi:hypothetical protein
MAQYDLKHVVVTIQDGTPTTPNSIELNFGDGTLSWDETTNREYNLDRGLLDTVRDGDEVPVELKFDGKLINVISDGSEDVTVSEALNKIGAAAAWVSADSDTCQPYAVKVIATYTPDCSGTNEVITFPLFRKEKCTYDLKTGKISVSGKCNVTRPTVERDV